MYKKKGEASCVNRTEVTAFSNGQLPPQQNLIFKKIVSETADVEKEEEEAFSKQCN
ncbi:hypothetical protein F2Q69_00044848 [Brassica cretica]|uniref:Uncharacterized protein n=1 Tax=Brassica cretica TaxID=69181 RepID=A0A8S9NCK1_BRACR|nr:hypothetical protein F2Q69_00044848 [Brassica cretica]